MTIAADVRSPRRFLAPDLARGFMLLFIAVANSHYFLQNAPALGGFPRETTGLDAVLVGLIATLVDGRAYPLFAALFGYGLVEIYRRRLTAAGKDPDRATRKDVSRAQWRPIRRLIRRRSLWMVAIGFLHGILLYVGDILAAYGLLAFLVVPALRWKSRTLVILAALAFALTSLPTGDSLTVESSVGRDPAMLPGSIWAGVVERAPALLVLVPLYPIGLVFPFLIGILAARARLLECPDRRLVLLRRVAIAGVGTAVAGGLPIALVLAGVVNEPAGPILSRLGTLHDATGHFGGLGYAAAIALLAYRITSRSNAERGRVVAAITAAGERSMTCYLAQSAVWTLAFAPYALDLTPQLSVTTVAALAIGTWLATVFLADWMRRHNRRGPFEVLLRKLTYRNGRNDRNEGGNRSGPGERAARGDRSVGGPYPARAADGGRIAGEAASGTTSSGLPEPLAGTDQMSEPPSGPVNP
ncbi:DUF418 domain-containing protein [Kribbella deserti]|uniref:DUF418 domain-containing protein n=1 Tax=Kribbella deserti TaxID=1926257 RepID=A0ABV6QTE1_9ACTN